MRWKCLVCGEVYDDRAMAVSCHETAAHPAPGESGRLWRLAWWLSWPLRVALFLVMMLAGTVIGLLLGWLRGREEDRLR